MSPSFFLIKIPHSSFTAFSFSSSRLSLARERDVHVHESKRHRIHSFFLLHKYHPLPPLAGFSSSVEMIRFRNRQIHHTSPIREERERVHH